MAINENIKAVEDLLEKCVKELDLRKKLALSKQIPEKISTILKLPGLTEAQKKKISEISAKWMEMQGAIVKEIDKQVNGLKKQANDKK